MVGVRAVDVVQISYPALKFTLMFGLEAVAFLSAAVLGARRAPRGVSGRLGLAGGVLGTLSSGTFAIGWAQFRWTSSSPVLDALSSPWLGQLDWVRAVAVALLAAALVTAHRSPQRSR
ncbi:hypothetical protein [Nocardioides flavescens]|uniref:Uncharacterized protein n=1 Tax=Nocardioides flavescens TaxID=2691959 RepID=A0A6L7F1W1_9ACTN|nr:hypothetical protein [Nocardioides flavescens]MXG91515.1 hypothetical protein [Nocardioides flavescens]